MEDDLQGAVRSGVNARKSPVAGGPRTVGRAVAPVAGGVKARDAVDDALGRLRQGLPPSRCRVRVRRPHRQTCPRELCRVQPLYAVRVVDTGQPPRLTAVAVPVRPARSRTLTPPPAF